MMTAFDQLTWGDPMLAQISGTDAQAYATDPTAHVLQNMTSGLEQAPTSLSEFVGGNTQPAQQAGGADPCSPAANPDGCGKYLWSGQFACWGKCINPLDPNTWSASAHAITDPIASGANKAVKKATGGAFDANAIIITAVVGLLAVGLVLLGVKNMMEA